MKQRLYNILICLLAISAVSCESFMDIHEEYVQDGEVIYAPKVDSVQFIAGKGRVQFAFWLENAPNVKHVDLYWNSRTDSLTTTVSPTTGVDSFYVVVPGLPEGAYTFEVKTRDNFGHSSLYLTGFGNSYGDFYQSSLLNRRVRTVEQTPDGDLVTWYGSLDGMTWTDVRYTTNDGETKTLRLSPSTSEVLLSDSKRGTGFEFASSFIPEELSIDTFETEWESYKGIYKYDRSAWSVLAVSDETASDGGGKNTLLDNNLDSYWHSQWDGGNAPLPHWAIIDMTVANRIAKLETYKRPGNNDARTIQYFVGPDPDPDASTWTQIGAAEFISGVDKIETTIADPSAATGRYLKIVLPDSNRDPFTSIAEIYVYGD